MTVVRKPNDNLAIINSKESAQNKQNLGIDMTVVRNRNDNLVIKNWSGLSRGNLN